MTLISVIIPCYNSSKTLRNTLDSIVQQDCTCDFEVIVSDDNSDDIDKIKLILHDYQNKFKTLILIESNENLGGGAARNKAIDIATGSYIAFLDSDDLWYKDKISTQINLYKSGSILTSRVHKGKSLDAAKVLPDIVKNEAEPISDALFISNKLIQTSTFFMESSIAKLVKFNSDLPRHQDYDFLLRAESLNIKIIQLEYILSFWFVPDLSSKRFLNKKATPEFFIYWYKEYNKYFTKKSKLAYVYKNIFSACMLTKKYSLFYSFINESDFSINEKIKIITNIVIWRLKRLLNG